MKRQLIRILLHATCALSVVTLAEGSAVKPTTVKLRDYVGIDWRHELVHYDLTFPPGGLKGAADAKVTLANGSAVPCQVSDVSRHEKDGSINSMRIWFFANVPSDGETVYTITPGQRGLEKPSVRVKETADTIELTTDAPKSIGIRLPNGKKEFDWPVPASQVPGPIQSLLLPRGKWVGEGRMEAPFNVKSYDARVMASGPLFAEVRVHYVFDTGYWTFRTKVIQGCPMIVIEEELDNGMSELSAEQFDRFFSFALNKGGFKPTEAYFTGKNDKDYLENLVKEGLNQKWKDAWGSLRSGWFISKVSGYTLSFKQDREDFYLTGYPTWSPRVGCLFRAVEPGGDAVGFAALNTAYWRNPLCLRFLESTNGQLFVNLPLQVYEQDWALDGFGRNSPNSTGRTLFVPDTTARRSYGIMLTPAEDEKKALLDSLFVKASKLGFHPLDEVKDWILDWPDPLADAKRATASTPKGTKALALMRERIRFKEAVGNFGRHSMAYHYDFAKRYYPVVQGVVDSPKALTAEERKELRRLCAYNAYEMNSLDTFPWGSGFHLGNPNMTIMAVEARVKASRLIQDHPMFAEWGAYSLALIKKFFERFTMSSGAPYENPHYTIGVSMDWAAEANQPLIDAGIGDALDSELFKKSMRFIINWLSPPDPRFLGHRLVLPLGNTSYQSVPPSFADRYVTYYRERDPVLAGQLQWFANQTLPDDKKVAIVKDIVPELKSGWFKDYGVIFRHGFGTPYETMMHFLAGRCFGHYELETDHMAYTIYAKGQPIHLNFGNGYFPMFVRPWLRNRVSFDMKMEAPERNRIEVEQASFSREAEYFRAVREVSQLLPVATEYPLLNEKNKWTPQESENYVAAIAEWDKPASFIPLTVWRRQMLFLKDADPKGPNYFVLRDTFGGTPTRPTDLSLWFLANSMTKTNNCFHFDGQCKVDMDVFINTPEEFTPKTDKYGHQQQPYGRLVGFDPAYHPGGKLWESQLLFRIRQPAGKGYMVVLYPRLKNDDPPAKFTRIAENVVKVETPLSTDYVFMNPYSFGFQNDQVSFEGMAAAVRLYKTGRIAVANSEGPCTVKVGGRSIVGHGAFVATIEQGKASTKTYTEGARVVVQ